jgi:hypothetical protein
VPDDDALSPATDAELVAALAHGRRFDERSKAHRRAAKLTARIAAETLARYRGQAGFVVMKRPPTKPHSTPAGG